jgi:6-phosphogluconolactonase
MNRSPIAAPAPLRLATLVGALCAMMTLGMTAPDARSAPSPAPAAGPRLVYFGTYTGETSRGIYVAPWDAASGTVGAVRLAAETANPSFLALHPTCALLYAVNEVDDFGGEKAGSVSAFAIDARTGDLRPLGRASSRGTSPCHLSVDPSGRAVLVANYGSGSIAALPIAADGGVKDATGFVQHQGSGADPQRQKGPHAHMIAVDPAGRLVLAADLGLDRVLLYRLDAARGVLSPADPAFAPVAPGSGPRHFAFSPDGRDLYVTNEMKVTVTGFRYDQGRLTEFQTLSSLPEGVAPGPDDSGAEIAVHPSGRFVYASNRGPDTLTVFARDAATGRLTPTGQKVEVGTPVSVAFLGTNSRP